MRLRRQQQVRDGARRVGRVLLPLLFLTLTFTAAQAQSTHSGVGSMPYSGGTAFRVWAPFASAVGVKGQFNGWSSAPLVNEGTGYWSGDLAGAGAGQEYRYVITYNGFTFDRTDARARRVTHSNGNSIIYDNASFDWQGDNFTLPWHNDLVIYEMHIGAFHARPNGWTPGHFSDAILKLDHLQALGINAIEVMPVNEFYGDQSWGYNPADLFAVESAFGGPDGFKAFVRECHQRGIAVLVDVVHNHYGPSDLSLWQYDGWNEYGHGGIYFYQDDRRYTDWGETRPDYGRVEVQDFIHGQVRMWLEDYHVDGFRWDAVYSITHTGFSENSQGADLMWNLNQTIHNDYSNIISIAEDDASGRGFDSEWDVGWHDGMKGQLTPSSDSSRSMSYVASLINNGSGQGRVLYTESHDTVATENGKVRLPRAIDGSDPTSIWARKRSLLGAGMVFTSVGIPMLFQGQEMLEDQGFKAQDALRWDRTNTYAGIVRAYHDLIRLRRNRSGDTQGLKGLGSNPYHIDDVNKVIAFHRWDQGGVGDDVVVVMNYAATTWTGGSYTIEFPYAGTWYALFNSDATRYGADFGHIGPTQVEATGNPPTAAVDMGMYATLIFARSKDTIPEPGGVTITPSQPQGCEPVTIRYDATGGPLDQAGAVYLSIGRNDWQDVLDPMPAMTLVSNAWTYTYQPTSQTSVINFIFTDGQGTWDNNGTLNWNVPMTDCLAIPSSVAVQPALPQGCDPVTLLYTPNEGPLQTATQVVLYIGRNGWQSIQDPPPAMFWNGTAWEYTVAPAPETEALNFIFHDGNTNESLRTWDNHDGENWTVPLDGCVEIFSIDVLSPPSASSVSHTSQTIRLAGVASSNLVGDLVVKNLSTGIATTLPAQADWTFDNVPLAEGTNVLVVYSIQALSPTSAADSASNLTYETGWETGQNGGTGFTHSWVLQGGANAGHFVADSASTPVPGIGTSAWGLWANQGSLSEASRSLDHILSVGATLRLQLQNHFIDTGRSAGVGLRNRDNGDLFEFYFTGGDIYYTLRDAAGTTHTTVPWTDAGLAIQFTLLTPDRYRLVVGSYTNEGSLVPLADRQIASLRTWNYSAGPGGDHNVYVNDLQVDGEQWGAMDSVTIIRLPPPAFTDVDEDGLPDSWEQVLVDYDTGDAIDTITDVRGWHDFDHDGQSNAGEFVADTDATDQAVFLRLASLRFGPGPLLGFQGKAGRTYRVWYRHPAESPSTWHLLAPGGAPLPADQLLEVPDASATNARLYRLEALYSP